MNIKTFAELSDIELFVSLHDAAKDVSYFEAAEGQRWYLEISDRNSANIRYKNISLEVGKRGLKADLTAYLV